MADTGLELYRQQIVGAIEAAKVGFTIYTVEIEYDNRQNMDFATLETPHLCAEIMFTGGSRGDLSNKPVHKIVGMLVLTSKVRDGKGPADCYRLLEHFYPKIQNQVVGSVRFEMADFDRPRLVTGWWGVSALIPFRINKFST
jgi:hypothetical protein